jgi:hypothetical protein
MSFALAFLESRCSILRGIEALSRGDSVSPIKGRFAIAATGKAVEIGLWRSRDVGRFIDESKVGSFPKERIGVFLTGFSLTHDRSDMIRGNRWRNSTSTPKVWSFSL